LKNSNRIGNIDGSICPFNNKDIVLDAGTGQGYLLSRLSAKCNSVYAIDTNLNLLLNIKSKLSCQNIILLNADLNKVPIRSEYFDKVICLEVLEHSPAPSEIINELHRVLKLNGLCVIAVPTYQSEKVYSKLNPNYDQNKGEHITVLRKAEWLSLFREAGFTLLGVANENFEHAIHWIFRNILRVEYDPSSGAFLEFKLIDKIFLLGMAAANIITFGIFWRIGNQIFPKSWYFYLTKR
jgi:ubiquinone/menaquinone biosynthesis C-methylase UbiE